MGRSEIQLMTSKFMDQENFEQLEKDLWTCVQCTQLLHPLVNTRASNSINGTELANATIRIRDSLIHEAILCLSRILDKNSKDRITIEKFISGNEDAKKKLEEIRNSQEWKNLLEIRNGRCAHNLQDRGDSVSWDKIVNISNQVIDLFNLVVSNKKFNESKITVVEAWNKIARIFWDKVFTGH